MQDNGRDTGSDSDNASVVSLSTCEEDTEEETETKERSRNTSHSGESHVIDESYLLQRVIWDRFLTFNEIIQKYINYVQSRYGKCVLLLLMGIEMAHQLKIMNIVEGR